MNVLQVGSNFMPQDNAQKEKNEPIFCAKVDVFA